MLAHKAEEEGVACAELIAGKAGSEAGIPCSAAQFLYRSARSGPASTGRIPLGGAATASWDAMRSHIRLRSGSLLYSATDD